MYISLIYMRLIFNNFITSIIKFFFALHIIAQHKFELKKTNKRTKFLHLERLMYHIIYIKFDWKLRVSQFVDAFYTITGFWKQKTHTIYILFNL